MYVFKSLAGTKQPFDSIQMFPKTLSRLPIRFQYLNDSFHIDIELLSNNFCVNTISQVNNRKYPKLKEVDDVLGGSAAWENVDSTAGKAGYPNKHVVLLHSCL